jgi:hypothetical protein
MIMKWILITTMLTLIATDLYSQDTEGIKRFEHFTESRGNSDNDLILTLPGQELVKLQHNLNSRSGLGPTFNYFGTVIVVDQVNVLPNGNKQLIIRREDGRNFYGYKPTLKAVLITNTQKETEFPSNNQVTKSK